MRGPHRRWSGFLVALSAALVSCGLPTPQRGDSTGADFFPLEPGRRWTYRVEEFALGWSSRSDVSARREVVSRLGAVAILDEASSLTDFDGPIVPMAYYWKGGYLRSVYLDVRNDRLVPLEEIASDVVLPARVAEGASWNSGSPDVDIAVTRQHRVSFERAAITVPAGTFRKCIRVETIAIQIGTASGERLEFRHTDWYAPGVGLVRSETYDPGNPRPRSVSVLVRFSPPEGAGSRDSTRRQGEAQ